MLSIFTVYNDDQHHIYEAWGWVCITAIREVALSMNTYEHN